MNEPFGGATKPIDAHAGGADADLLGALVNDVTGFPAHGLEVKHTSTAAVTNRRFIASFADHLWIIDRPDALRAFASRLNWSESGRPASPPSWAAAQRTKLGLTLALAGS